MARDQRRHRALSPAMGIIGDRTPSSSHATEPRRGARKAGGEERCRLNNAGGQAEALKTGYRAKGAVYNPIA